MAVASRGRESVMVENMKREGPTSTVPGEGGVKNDAGVRGAPGSGERSAAHFTEPATRKMGG